MQNSLFFFLTGWRSLALAAACLILAGACGTLRPLPETFAPQDYAPIEYQELLQSRGTGLHEGQKVRVKAYFWQFLTYEPALIRNILTLPRHPVGWSRLRWFATYGSEDMTGYFELAAMTPEQEARYDLKRLDPILIYGEISALRPGWFLSVHHIEKTFPE